MFKKYDVIVVGGGHAGCEAAAAAANMGSSVLLVTMNLSTIGQMSCNPAMGGVAKGQIIRELDALGGYSGKVTDKSTIQFRMLNRSKGPAMWSPRAQNDRALFSMEWRLALEQTINIDFWQDVVSSLIIDNGSVTGIVTAMGISIYSSSVILTNGTFLNGLIHIGEQKIQGGRSAEKSVTGLTEQLTTLGFESGRMKTGTPPRLDGRSLNYAAMEEQKGDEEGGRFSFTNTAGLKNQKSCFITYTNNRVHDILKSGFDKSPMFTGRIKGLGPRYCPSIEDKINRFADKTRHQIFIEPEGLDTVEIYINGFSTSLPADVQFKALKKIAGLEKVKMFRPGYAIEYDYFPPTQLTQTLETKLIKNLYFAGQINGTTGYEEAACQGWVAGVNATLSINENPPFIMERSDSYIGVLVDDLVTKGTDEPYRMFTSRAEHRLFLRQDNADQRLTRYGHKLGLINDERMKEVEKKEKKIEELIRLTKTISVQAEDVNDLLINYGTPEINQSVKIRTLVVRPNIRLGELMKRCPAINKFDTFNVEEVEQAEILLKYDSYLEKENLHIERMHKMESQNINPDFNYKSLVSLSMEAREKLHKIKPSTIGQASRISGVSPSDISVLMIHMAK